MGQFLPSSPKGQFSPNVRKSSSLGKLFNGTSTLSSPRGNRNRAHGGSNNASDSFCRLIERMVILSLGATILFMSRQSNKHNIVTNEELLLSQKKQEKLTAEIGRWEHQNQLLENVKDGLILKKGRLEQLNEVLNRENEVNNDIKQINSDLQQKFTEKEIAMEKLELSFSETQQLMVKVQHREEAFLKNVDILKHKIMLESYRDAYERFGIGPHYVKFWVELPPEENGSQQIQLYGGKYSEFTIKLYPLDAMPHSVHLFLEQVHHKLWDGCKFLINALHITQTGSTGEQTTQFGHYNLDKVFFQEYNKDYPHKQWTVGFAGRPGGPDFYINKIDNTKTHGPHGQGQWDLPEEADPCFGEIVDGKEVIMRFNEVQNSEINNQLAEPISIYKAWIVRQDDPAREDVPLREDDHMEIVN